VFIRLSFISKGLVVFFLISAAVGGSCTASYMAVYPEPINIKSIIAPGDIVRVTTKDNRKVEFKSRGLHIMLIQPTEKFGTEKFVELKLVFENSGTKVVKADVLKK